MNAEQKKLFREALLAQLKVMRPGRLDLHALRRGIQAAGFTEEDIVIRQELDYLADKLLITSELDELSAGVVRWKITALGVDYCEEHNL